VSSRRGRSRSRGHSFSVARVKAPRRWRIIGVTVILLVLVVGAAASSGTPQGKDILAAVQRFMLFYSGVLALIALTAAVGVGIVATDRIIMAPASRVVAQAVHRAVSFAALAFLVAHIVLEILAHRSHVVDAFVPFLAQHRTFYVGLGTIASDLVIVLIVTGIARGRFASKWPWTWRAIHATAYLCWPLSIVHGLLAGRTAKPYVDWSYGACLAAVGLALVIRLVATVRSNREKAAQPLPDHFSTTIQGAVPAMAQRELQDRWSAAQPARDPRGAMPPAQGPWGAVPQARPVPRALPSGSGGGPRGPQTQPQYPLQPQYPPSQPQYPPSQPQYPPSQPQYPSEPQYPPSRPPSRPQYPPPSQPQYISARRLATPRPDLPIPPEHQQELQQGMEHWQRQQQQRYQPPGPSDPPDDPGYPAYPGQPGQEGS
jgi:hypothetical protein